MEVRRITCKQAWDNPAWKHIEEQYRIDLPNLDFDPDIDTQDYELLERLGNFHCVGAFDGDRLVGILSFFESLHPLKRDFLVARSELLWVDPSIRGKGIAVALMKEATAWAKERGCGGFYWCVRYGTRADEIMQRHFGNPAEVNYWQQL